MRKFLLVAAGVVLASGGVAWAQMPPNGPPPGGPEHQGGWMHRWHHHEGDGAAFFRFRQGDAEMDIKCPSNEQVQACVSAASTLMDKVGAMGAGKTP